MGSIQRSFTAVFSIINLKNGICTKNQVLVLKRDFFSLIPCYCTNVLTVVIINRFIVDISDDFIDKPTLLSQPFSVMSAWEIRNNF